jgi:quinolinate synthase
MMYVGGMIQIRGMCKISDMAGDGVMSYFKAVIKACIPEINIMPYVNTVAEINIMSDICPTMIRAAVVPA